MKHSKSKIQKFTTRIFAFSPHLFICSGTSLAPSLLSRLFTFFLLFIYYTPGSHFSSQYRLYLTHSAISVCRFFIFLSNTLDKWMSARSASFSIFQRKMLQSTGGFSHYDKFSNLCYPHSKTDLSSWSHHTTRDY